jgi:hypothetical protein
MKIFAIFALVVILCGCRSASSVRVAAESDYFKQSGQLYKAYLDADLDHARQDLQDIARLGETTQKLEPNVQANSLLRAYSWLFALEKRAGNQDLAELYFAKARYWVIRQHELWGESDSDISARLKTFTGEKCIADVDSWDKGASKGRGAHYVQVIQ